MYVSCFVSTMGRARHRHLRICAPHLFPIGGSDSGRKVGAMHEDRPG